jgi:glycosyltransferase involved in cell wall biosynthesis
MRILFLSAWYPDKFDKMPGLFVKRHAEAVSLFCEVIVLYISSVEKQKTKYCSEKNDENGLKTYIIYYKRSNKLLFNGIFKILRFLKAYYIGWKLILKDNYKPDIIHVNILTRTGVIAYFLYILYNIPYIVTEHWTRYLRETNNYKGVVRKFITQIIVRNAKAITSVTENLKWAMEQQKLRNNKFYIVPNAVNLEKFKIIENNDQENKIVFSHISCFVENQKNICGIINAVSELSKKRNDFECHLIGYGPDYSLIKNFSDKLNLTDKFIFFDGLKEEEELMKIINRSAFTLLFSNYENLPVVLLESLACGVPVISTNVGGICEFIGREQGLLIEKKNQDLLIEAILKHLNKEAVYNRQEIRNYAKEKFSFQIIGEKFNSIYEEVLKTD